MMWRKRGRKNTRIIGRCPNTKTKKKKKSWKTRSTGRELRGERKKRKRKY